MALGYIILASYWTVLVAELIGDKSIYTVASLSLRFRAGLVFLGITAAFMGKMLVAVLLGETLAQAPAHWTAAASAAVFFLAAALIWFRGAESERARGAAPVAWGRAVAVPFASLFLTEWGDPGQIAAAALAARTHLPQAVWLGGTLALMTKGALALTLGLKLRESVSERLLRTLAATSCCLLGLLALSDTLSR